MNLLATYGSVAALLVGGILIGAGFGAWLRQPAPPLNLSDAQTVIARLRPLVGTSWSSDLRLTVLADGEIKIDLEAARGISYKASGKSLEEVLDKLRAASPEIAAALRGPTP